MARFEEENPEGVETAEIVVGIPSYNEADTIGNVVEVVDQGLETFFADRETVIVNVDNASPDGTGEAFLAVQTESPKIYLSTPEGIRGKGNNVLNLMQKSCDLGAEAIATVDADLRSIEPRWIQKLANPVLKGFDFVTPIYLRHKYDGTITNNIAYPLVGGVLGHRLRQPIGGEFGLSTRLARELLGLDISESVRHFGIDIWLTAHACMFDARICQAFMDAPKIHNPKDPGASLDGMFRDVISVLFDAITAHSDAWLPVATTAPSIMFGFGMGARRRPEAVTVETGPLHRRFIQTFNGNSESLQELMAPEVWGELQAAVQGDPFELRISYELWCRIVYDAILAYAEETSPGDDVVELLLSLYKGKVLSDILELTEMGAWVAERHVERQVDCFEHNKPYLVESWKERFGTG